METVTMGRRIIRDKSFRIQPTPDKKTIGFADILGNLDLVDCASLNQVAQLDLKRFVGAAFYDEALSWGSIEGHGPARITGRIMHELRSLIFSATSQFTFVGVGALGMPVNVLTWRDGISWDLGTPTNGDDASALAFSPDGKMLAIGDHSSLCRIIDLEHMRERMVFTAHQDVEQGLFIEGIAFSPDGTYVASVNEGMCAVWNPHTGQAAATAVGCEFVKFSPNEEIVLFSDRREFFLWRFVSGEKQVFQWDGASIGAGDWSLSGRQIVTGDVKGRIKIRDVATCDIIGEFVNDDGSEVLDLSWVQSGILVLYANGAVELLPT
jgi:hypothetical protein